MKPLIDPIVMPVTNETAEERYKRSLPLFNTPGLQYVEKRGISPEIAHKACVRFDPDWNGRPAVIVPIVNADHKLCSLHGRYLSIMGKQNKMFTVGPGGEHCMLVMGGPSSLLYSSKVFLMHCLSLCAVIVPWLPWADMRHGCLRSANTVR